MIMTFQHLPDVLRGGKRKELQKNILRRTRKQSMRSWPWRLSAGTTGNAFQVFSWITLQWGFNQTQTCPDPAPQCSEKWWCILLLIQHLFAWGEMRASSCEYFVNDINMSWLRNRQLETPLGDFNVPCNCTVAAKGDSAMLPAECKNAKHKQS